MKSIIFLISCFLIIGCVAPTQGGNRVISAQQAETRRAEDYNLGLYWLDLLKKSWDEGSANMVESKIDNILRMAGSMNTVGFYNYSKEATERYVDLSFKYADHCLKEGQLDRADKAYRQIINNLIGSAYGGYRDRAKIGIDDVKAARNTIHRM